MVTILGNRLAIFSLQNIFGNLNDWDIPDASTHHFWIISEMAKSFNMHITHIQRNMMLIRAEMQ